MNKTTHSLNATKLNLQAQVSSLKQDIGTVSGELTSLITEASALRAENARQEAFLAETLIAREAFVKQSIQQLDELERKERTTKERLSVAEDIKSKAKEVLTLAYAKADDMSSKAKKKVTQLKVSITQLETEATKARKNILVLQEGEESIKKTITREKKNLRELVDEYNTTAKSIETLIDEGTKILEELSTEVEVSQNRLDKNEEEWANRVLLVEERERIVTQRESDAGVMVRRIQKIYKELFPNRKLNI